MVVVLCCLFEAIFLPKSLNDKNPFQSFYVELNFRKKKSLLNYSDNPNDDNIELHLNCLSRSIDSLSSKYENNFTWQFQFRHG